MSLLRPFKKGSSKSSRNAQRARLQVEILETRCLLTSGLNASTSATTTTVTPSASTVIQGMFQVLLGRPATPGEELIYMNVLGLLQNQQTAVAAQILGSEAYRQQAVKDLYGHDSQPGVLH